MLDCERLSKKTKPSVTPEFKKSFGARVLSLSAERGLSAEDICFDERMNYSSTNPYYDWVEGKKLPGYEKLVPLSDILETTVDYLLRGGRSVRANVDVESR